MILTTALPQQLCTVSSPVFKLKSPIAVPSAAACRIIFFPSPLRTDVKSANYSSGNYSTLTYGEIIVLTTDQGHNSLTLTDFCLTSYLDRYGINYSPNDLVISNSDPLKKCSSMYSINDDSLITCTIHPTTKNEQNEELWKDDLALIAMNGEGGEACEAAEGW